MFLVYLFLILVLVGETFYKYLSGEIRWWFFRNSFKLAWFVA